ncbi:hypothetical protein FHS15_005796 [Paenibacillus castaneae]|uniref:hypothetical protein n=1 Tax=Paenibacillus castaneae TaxID=474957 RepID=UPI00141ADBA8|nr:hypothetical protein [Paenibacillus castaneae]NIK80605.1 hypothetical protein [Paenibacillus castaneae]
MTTQFLSFRIPTIKLTFKKTCIMLLIVIIAYMGVQPPKADAFAPLVALGAVEVGALAFWGGAVLVASVGVAVGLDPAVADEITAFGKSAWDGANDAMKASISWATSAMSLNSSQTYSVSFTPETRTYLQTAWRSHFSTSNSSYKPLAIDPSTKLITPASSIVDNGVPIDWVSPAPWTNLSRLEMNTLLRVSARDITQEETDNVNNAIRPYYVSSNWRLWGLRMVDVTGKLVMTEVVRTSTNVTSWNAIDRDQYSIILQPSNKETYYTVGLGNTSWYSATATTSISRSYTLSVERLVNPITRPITTPDVLSPALPTNVPDVFTMPAPQGVLNPTGDMVTLANPTIGYPSATIPANPWDVAIGFPAIPGQIADLSPTQTIATPAEVPVPTVPDVPIPDATGILGWLNGFWDKFVQMLKNLFIPSAIDFAPIGNIWANRFPAIDSIATSLRSLTVLNYEQNPPKFNIIINKKSYTFIDLTAVPPSWMDMARTFMRISIWSGFIFMILREWRPRPHLG